MPKVAEQKDILRPHELCRLGERVTIFTAEKADDDYHWGRYKGKVKIVHVENSSYVQFAVRDFIQANGGQVYTGMNKENDWSRTFYWDKGWHIVNRSGDYAVVQTPECGVDCNCEDTCDTCVYKDNCIIRGDLVHWCKSYATTVDEATALSVAEK